MWVATNASFAFSRCKTGFAASIVAITGVGQRCCPSKTRAEIAGADGDVNLHDKAIVSRPDQRPGDRGKSARTADEGD